MYHKNNLMTKTLITAEEVIFHAPTKHTLDPRMVESSILVAEERFIKPLLGYALYNAIIEAKNVEVDLSNQATLQAKMDAGITLAVGDLVNAFEFLTNPHIKLWKQKLWKITAEAVVTSAYPEGFVQFGSEGTMHNNPPAGLMVTSGAVIPLLSSIKYAVDKKVQERIGPLTHGLHEYLCNNKVDFPTYAIDCSDCLNADPQKMPNVGVALNLYEDDEDCGCDEPGWMLKS